MDQQQTLMEREAEFPAALCNYALLKRSECTEVSLACL